MTSMRPAIIPTWVLTTLTAKAVKVGARATKHTFDKKSA